MGSNVKIERHQDALTITFCDGCKLCSVSSFISSFSLAAFKKWMRAPMAGFLRALYGPDFPVSEAAFAAVLKSYTLQEDVALEIVRHFLFLKG